MIFLTISRNFLLLLIFYPLSILDLYCCCYGYSSLISSWSLSLLLQPSFSIYTRKTMVTSRDNKNFTNWNSTWNALAKRHKVKLETELWQKQWKIDASTLVQFTSLLSPPPFKLIFCSENFSSSSTNSHRETMCYNGMQNVDVGICGWD